MLRGVGVLADRLGKEGLRDLGFDVPVGRITAHSSWLHTEWGLSCLLHLT